MIRRTTIAVLIGSIVLGGLALAVVPQATSGQEAELGDLRIPNNATTTDDGQVDDIFIDVETTYEYNATEKTPDEVDFELQVEGDVGGYDTIASKTLTDVEKDESGSVRLNGSVFDSTGYSQLDWTVQQEGERIQKNVPVRLKMTVSKEGGNTVTETVTDEVMIIVEYEDKTMQVEMSIGGDGEVVFDDS